MRDESFWTTCKKQRNDCQSVLLPLTSAVVVYFFSSPLLFCYRIVWHALDMRVVVKVVALQ